MPSERQIQANRANAKRSTGPTSEAGKKVVSQNAVRHGLRSRTCVLLKAESARRFDALLSSLIEEFQPATPNEHLLVETMAAARWRQMRTWTLQTAAFELETARQDPAAGSAPVITAMAFRSLADSSQSLHLLQRYETSLDRQYSRALSLLLKSPSARIAEPGSPPVNPQPPLNLILEGTWPSEPDTHPGPPANTCGGEMRETELCGQGSDPRSMDKPQDEAQSGAEDIAGAASKQSRTRTVQQTESPSETRHKISPQHSVASRCAATP